MKYGFFGDVRWRNIYTEFVESRPSGWKFSHRHADRQTERQRAEHTSPPWISFTKNSELNFFSPYQQSEYLYPMSWCAGCLGVWLCRLPNVVRSPPARRSLSWVQSLLIELWLLVIEVSTLNLNLLTTQTMVTTGILPSQGKSPW